MSLKPRLQPISAEHTLVIPKGTVSDGWKQSGILATTMMTDGPNYMIDTLQRIVLFLI